MIHSSNKGASDGIQEESGNPRIVKNGIDQIEELWLSSFALDGQK